MEVRVLYPIFTVQFTSNWVSAMNGLKKCAFFAVLSSQCMHGNHFSGNCHCEHRYEQYDCCTDSIILNLIWELSTGAECTLMYLFHKGGVVTSSMCWRVTNNSNSRELSADQKEIPCLLRSCATYITWNANNKPMNRHHFEPLSIHAHKHTT